MNPVRGACGSTPFLHSQNTPGRLSDVGRRTDAFLFRVMECCFREPVVPAFRTGG
jgi:hypothetical protein